jgi:ankyrin repeat protein
MEVGSDVTTTDIFEAIAAGNLERARELVARDPAVAGARDEQGLSAVTQAMYHGRRDVAEVLLASAPELDVFEASAVGRIERVRTLVEREPELVSRFSPDGFTPLHLAAFFGHLEIVRLLIAGGSDPKAVARNPMRVQPLHSAAATRQVAIARLLVEAGADVNEPQERGFTPLHAAAQNGDVELTRLLLERGADRERATDDGLRAADFASRRGSAEVVALLEKEEVG